MAGLKREVVAGLLRTSLHHSDPANITTVRLSLSTGRESLNTDLDVVSDESQAVLDTLVSLDHGLRHQVRPSLPSSQPCLSSSVVGLAHHVLTGVEGSSDVDMISQAGLTDIKIINTEL